MDNKTCDLLLTKIDELSSLRFLDIKIANIIRCDFIMDTRFNHKFEKCYYEFRKVVVETGSGKENELKISLPSIYLLTGFRFECLSLIIIIVSSYLIVHFNLKLDFQLFEKVIRTYDMNGYNDVIVGIDAIFPMYAMSVIYFYVHFFNKIEDKVRDVYNLIDDIKLYLTNLK